MQDRRPLAFVLAFALVFIGQARPQDPDQPVRSGKARLAIDGGNHVILVFSNDGKKLLQTIGTCGEKGQYPRRIVNAHEASTRRTD